jgi:hypothetical protein
MDLNNSFDAKVMLKPSANWLLHAPPSSYWKSHSQWLIFMDTQVERQIHELWVQEFN